MIADLLNRRSLGSLTSLQEDSLSNFNDAFTIYGHPKVKDVLKAFEQLQVVQLPNYRTALKLRAIQRKMQLHRVDARDIVSVFAESALPAPSEEIGEAEMEPIINDVCLMAERNSDATIVSCADLILTWLLQLFDSNYMGAVTVKQFTTALVIMGSGRLLDKLKYLFDTFKSSDGSLTQHGFSEMMTDLLLIPCSVFEEEIYGHSTLVISALFDCFNQFGKERQKLSQEEFLQWSIQFPFCLSWLFAFHRLMCAEYSVNLTSCSHCGTAPYLGFRYISLHSYNVAICQECVWTGNCEDTEYREFGALSQCVNVTVVPRKTRASTTSVADSSGLSSVHQSLDKRHVVMLNYCKRLEPSSTSHFLSLSDTVETSDDNIEALIGECEDRANKLQKDFNAFCKEHSEILKFERKNDEQNFESLQVWKKRDDLSSRLAVWMSRRNDLYIKQESLLQEQEIPLPTLTYVKCGPLGSVKSLSSESSSTNNKIMGSLNGIDKMSTKVSVEDSVMVLSKLSLIINNVLLQKSLSSTPSKTVPLKQVSRDSSPMSPMSFENKTTFAISNGNLTSGVSKENITTNIQSSQDDVSMTTTEKAVMREFENTMNDIMIQENLISTPQKIIPLEPEEKDDQATPTLDVKELDFSEVNLKKSAASNLGPLSNEEDSKRSYEKCQVIKEHPDVNQDKNTAPKQMTEEARPHVEMPSKPKSILNGTSERSKETENKASAKRSPKPPKRSMLPVPKSQIPAPAHTPKNRSKIPVCKIPVHPSRSSKSNPPEPINSKNNSPLATHISVQNTDKFSEGPEESEKVSEGAEDSEEVAKGAAEDSEEKVSEGGEEEEREDDEWVSEGSWETEEENTATERSLPPESLNLAGDVSEPECDPPEPCDAPPVPPPRTLLSPQGVARRATSLKTKSEGDPRMEELRKVTRASSSVHTKPKPTGIPLRSTPTIPGSTPILSGNTPSVSSSSASTPPPRQYSRIPTPKTNTPDLSIKLGVTPSSTPELLSRIGSDNSARSTPEVAARPRLAAKPGNKPTTPFRGPIVYEGDSDSDTSTSSSSSSDVDKKSKFKRARSARFARTKVAPPSRNAASFRVKKGSSKPEQPLEFFNSFAE